MTEKLTLSELQLLIRDSLYLSLPGMFWVTAEISEMNVNASGHCYLELVEKNAGGSNVKARIRAVIWSSRFGFIRSFFSNITGENLRSGIRVLVKAKVEYHELYGLSLVISDIDPSFTLGELAMKRQQIINRLEAEGVISMNRDLPFPILPQRIAVISSGSAAGYTDFIRQLHGNSYGYVFHTALFESPVQGTETEQGITGALDRIADHAGLFDLVAIIRGGGSQTDLSWFDSYAIAYHITQFPLPVVTGIGHDKNLSVTDLVACKAFKTPTAVAGYLIDCMAEAENQLTGYAMTLKDLTAIIVRENQKDLDSYSSRLLPYARIQLAAGRERIARSSSELARLSQSITYRSGISLANLSARLGSGSRDLLAREGRLAERFSERLPAAAAAGLSAGRDKLERLGNLLGILDPVNVLKRGYTITSLRGRIIRTGSTLSDGDEIATMFCDTIVKSRVTGKKEKE